VSRSELHEADLTALLLGAIPEETKPDVATNALLLVLLYWIGRKDDPAAAVETWIESLRKVVRALTAAERAGLQ
jgi:hypothetical protein